MQDPLHLAELLCARICHDLSGPLGALLAATELAAEEAAATSEAQTVAAESAAVLGARLQGMRSAWAADTGPLDVPQFRELAAGLTLGRRVEVDLAGLDPTCVFAPAAARLALNVVLLAVEALASNGRVTMAGSAAADVLVTLDGPRAAWPAGLARCLVDEGAAWEAMTGARTLQGPLTALLARRSGLRLSLLLPAGANPGPAPLLMSLAASA